MPLRTTRTLHSPDLRDRVAVCAVDLWVGQAQETRVSDSKARGWPGVCACLGWEEVGKPGRSKGFTVGEAAVSGNGPYPFF